MASDGSNQLKVHFKCPQCREKYQCTTYPSDIIIHSVVLLREASALEPSLLVADSGLNATILNRKKLISKVNIYGANARCDASFRGLRKEIGKEWTLPPLDWELWRPLIAETSEGLSLPAAVPSPLHHEEQKQWSDPTLFYGLDELMTCDEQEFVTHLMVQGKPELLAQGAHILHGILDMTTTRTTPQSSFNSSAMTVPRARPIDPTALQRVRKRYPLPPRMPRCVRMPRYDLSGRSKPLKFERDDKLSLVQVRGPAGQLGLRKGDIVTHINGESVNNSFEFETALQQNGDSDDGFWLVVNCDEETARALQARYLKMTREKVHFHKHE